MSRMYTMHVLLLVMCTTLQIWTLSLDILLITEANEKCPHPVVCQGNDSAIDQLNMTFYLVSAQEQFAASKTVRSVHGDVMIMASHSSCQRHFTQTSTRDDFDISFCSDVCTKFLSNQEIYVHTIFNVTNAKQLYFNSLVTHDSKEVVMRSIVSILNHVKWKTFVVITSSYRVFTALSEGRQASVKLLLYMIDDPSYPSVDLANIYEQLPEKDLNFLVMCPSNCIRKLLNQVHMFESKTSVEKSTGVSQWLMVPSTGSVTDIAHSHELFKTDDVVFLEFMPCLRYYLPLNLEIIMKNLPSLRRFNITGQAAETTGCVHKTAAISEVLSADPTGKLVDTVGYIGSDGNVQVKHQLYHSRKYGFHNRTLIVGTLEWPPYVIRKVENGSVKFDGLCIQLLQELAKQLNFSYTLVEPEDREWSRILNGSWTGLVKLLIEGDVDMIIAPMAVSENRNAVIDFTVPYSYVHSALIFKKQDPNTNKWLTLLSLFRYEVLVCIFVSFIFSTVILFVIEELAPVSPWTDDRPSDMRTRYGDIFWYHFGALMANGGSYLPNTESGRTVLSCWWLFTVIMAATYSGNLIAFLTDGREKPPFSSLAEMVQQDTYNWGFVGGTALVTLFQESNISAYHKVWHGIEEIMANEPDWLSLDGDVHMRRVVERQYVYMAEESTLEMWDDPRRCGVQMIRDNFQFSKYAVGLPKHSRYTQVFSEQILRIYESGLLQLWWDRWKPKHQCPTPSRKAKRVDMLTLQSAFYGAGVGVAISLLILACEIIHKRRQKQRPQRKSECVEENSIRSDISSQELSHPDTPSRT